MVVSKRSSSVFVCLALACLVALPAMGASRVADLNVGGASLDWAPQVSYQSMKLTVSGPGGFILEREFASGETPSLSIFDKAGQRLADGNYIWELRSAPQIGAAVKRQLAAARRSGDEVAIDRLREQGLLPEGGVQSGTFKIANGSFVADESQAEQRPTRVQDKARVTAADQVIPDDLIVQGSACVGFDCVNNESFGFDTIRMKENNLRIKAEDTSVGTFPTNDWQLTFNDSASGGASKFSVEDITGSKVPFTITAGASTNSIFVDSTGRVGFRTSTPVLDLHVNTGNTPALRLEQNNSSGFTAQTWDVAGNEANFFVRDVTGGSRLPFRIRPGAPTSSIDISADGDVGIGTGSPSNKLHVSSTDAAADGGKVLIQNSNTGAATARELLELNNKGAAILIFKDTSLAPRWSFGTSGTSFVVDNQAHAGVEMSLDQNGNVVFLGTVTPNSSRTVKQDFAAIDPHEALNKVLGLPITTWTYKHDPGVRHIGPMAEDFFEAFKVGPDARGISTTDSAGVTFAAIQGLHQELEAKDAEILTLQQRLAALEAMVAKLAKN